MYAWQATVQDDAGNVVPFPVVTVYKEDGITLANIFNESGAPLPNPLTGTMDGFVQFWATSGGYKIEGASGADQTEVWDVYLGSDSILPSYAAAVNEAANTNRNHISAIVSGDVITWVRVSGGTCLGGGWYPSGEGTPLHWGAVRDNTTDDTAAVNQMFDWVRSKGIMSQSQRPVTVTGGSGVYFCSGSINATNIENAKGWVVRDFFIKSHAYNLPALDMSGARWWNLDNIQIWGGDQFNTTLRPWSGILLARSAKWPNSHGLMSNVNVDGYFLGAALQDYAAEEICAVKSTFWNRAVAGGSSDPSASDYAPAYATIFDGRGRIPCKSAHATIVSGRQSFTVSNFISCAFQKPYAAPGPTVYMSDMCSVNFTKPYITNGSGAAIDWYLFNDFRPYNVTLDGWQIETTGNDSAIRFLPMDVSGTLGYGVTTFKASFGNLFSESEVFFVDHPTAAVRLESTHIEIPRFQSGTPTNGVFHPKQQFLLIGANIVVPNGESISPIADFGVFTGSRYMTLSSGVVNWKGTINSLDGLTSSGPVILNNIPIYPDNAAAISGGLAVGRVYRTGTGNLMIRY